MPLRITTLEMCRWGGGHKRKYVADCYITVVIIIIIVKIIVILNVLGVGFRLLLYLAPCLFVIKVLFNCK